MKSITYLIAFSLIISSAPSAQADRIIPHTDIAYIGSFSLPASTEEEKCYQWNYALANLEFNPAGDPEGASDGYPGSLFVTGKTGCPTLAEVNIPKPSIQADYRKLNVSKVLTPFTDIGNGDLEGLPNGSNTIRGVGDVVIIGEEQGISPAKLLQVTHKDYTVANPTNMLSSLNVDFSTSVGFSGWWTLEGIAPAEYQHYLFKIPKAWADKYTGGKSIIVGSNRQADNGSHGATMYAISPWTSSTPPANGTTINAIELISYKSIHNMDGYTFSNLPADMVWVESGTKSAIIASYLYGMRWRLYSDTITKDWTLTSHGHYYGNRHPEGTGSKGFHHEPYHFTLMFYDPDDLAAVTLGSKESYEVQPYAWYDVSQYFYKNPYTPSIESKNSAGIAYDATNHYLYVAEPSTAKTGDHVIIHTFLIQEKDGVLDTTAPSAPQDLTITNTTDTTISLSWASASDTNGVNYIIYLNGYPVLRTSDTKYEYNYVEQWRTGDDTAEGWPATDSFSFKIAAEDDYHNLSEFSNTVTKDYSGSLQGTPTLGGNINKL